MRNKIDNLIKGIRVLKIWIESSLFVVFVCCLVIFRRRIDLLRLYIIKIINRSLSNDSPVVVDCHSNMCKVSSYRDTRQPRYQWQTPQYRESKWWHSEPFLRQNCRPVPLCIFGSNPVLDNSHRSKVYNRTCSRLDKKQLLCCRRWWLFHQTRLRWWRTPWRYQPERKYKNR